MLVPFREVSRQTASLGRKLRSMIRYREQFSTVDDCSSLIDAFRKSVCCAIIPSGFEV
jgi:hypothetical protein